MATIIGASITASVTLTAALLAYVFGRFQKAFEVRYTSFYEHQAKVASDLYSLVYAISEEFKQWLALHEENDDSSTEKSKQKSVIEKEIEKFRKCYTENDLWISGELWGKLDGLHEELDRQWLSVELPTRESNVGEEIERFLKARFPEIRSELRTEFHRALEVEHVNPSDSDVTDSDVILKGRPRMVVGVVGTLLFGLGTGALLSHFLDSLVGLVAGGLMGLGLGLILEYVKPSRKQ